MVRMKCVKCSAEIPDGSTFCSVCGKKQVAEKRKALKRANGTGSVYKLSGRRRRPWTVAINNIRIGYYETKTDAMQALSSIQGKKLNDMFNITFEEAYLIWSAEHFKTISPQAIVCYANAFKLHAVDIYKIKMRDLRTRDYQALIDKMDSDGKSLSSIEKLRQLLSQMSKWAVREEIASNDFGRFVKMPKREKKEKNTFSEEDILKLWNNVENETVKIVLILLYTGVRIGELFSIRKSDVNLKEGYMIGGEKTEAGRDRIIPFPDKIMSIVNWLYDAAPDGGLLIDGYSGNKNMSNFRKREYYPTLDQLGIERITPHGTRHTYITRAVQQGIDLDEIGRLVGHVDKETTKLYLHDEASTIRDLVKNLE